MEFELRFELKAVRWAVNDRGTQPMAAELRGVFRSQSDRKEKRDRMLWALIAVVLSVGQGVRVGDATDVRPARPSASIA